MLEPGTTLGGYQILEEIGAGGTGVVFRAEHQLLGRQVAIKALRPELAQREDLSGRFLAEARAINDLAHPNIVRIQDFARDDSKTPPIFYMVMELLEGGTLGKLVRKHGPLGLEQALAIANQVAGALASVHASNRMHRDLKTENVFLVPSSGGSETVKLLDFGLVKALGEQQPAVKATDPGTAVGTPAYMAPEQILEGEEIDPRVDIYALGVVLYEMLAGRVPFFTSSYGELMVAIVKDPPPSLSALRDDIPPAVVALVLRCLEKKPADRFQTVGELQHAIKALGCSLCGKIHPEGSCRVDDDWDVDTPPSLTASSETASNQTGPRLDEPATLTIEAEPLEPTSPLPAGATIGAYRVLDVIGKGGMGIVYRAVHESLRRQVALKLLRGVYAAEGDAVQRVFREALTASRINHPNIVAITDFIQEKGIACYVMEYLEGEPLIATLKRRKALDVDETLAIVEQIAAGLAALHGAGVIHRDLKPGNIFLAAREGHPARVKLLDFGLSELSDEVTGGGDSVLQDSASDPTLATPEYCAPEQIRSPRAIDHRADLYSLGVVTYMMLVGERPHQSTENQLLADICSKTPVAPSERGVALPKRLDALIMRCLTIEPEGRPDTAAEVLDELRAIIRGRAAAAAQVRSRTRLRWELICLALVALAAGGYLVWQSRSKPPAPAAVHAPKKTVERPIARLEILLKKVDHRRRDRVQFASARKGMDLHHLDALRTGAGSHARVIFHAGGRLDVLAWSTVLIEAPEADGTSPVARLKKGTVHAQVKPGKSLRIIAPGGRESVVEARGNKPLRLRVRQRKSGLEVVVLRGKARVSSAGRKTDLARGQFVDVGGTTLEPAKLPPFPKLAAPAVDALVSGKIALAWKRVDRATLFRLQVARTLDFRQLLVDRRLKENRLALGKLALGRYVWRVSSIDAKDREGEFGFSRRFTVLAVSTLGFSAKDFAPRANTVLKVLEKGTRVAFRWPKTLAYHALLIKRDGETVVRRRATGKGTRVRLAPGIYHWRLVSRKGKSIFRPRRLTLKRRKPPKVIPKVDWPGAKKKGP